MATVALIAYAVYVALAFGLRTVVQIRRTGSSGFKGISGRPASAEWLAARPPRSARAKTLPFPPTTMPPAVK